MCKPTKYGKATKDLMLVYKVKSTNFQNLKMKFQCIKLKSARTWKVEIVLEIIEKFKEHISSLMLLILVKTIFVI